MRNTFTYFPHEKEYGIHLGKKGDLGLCMVDQAGFDLVSSIDCTWTASGGYPRPYVKRYKLSLHAMLLRVGPGFQVDHKDGDPMNNRISNLRVADFVQNQANRKLNRNSTSGYKGVSRDKSCGNWKAYIRVNGKLLHLGNFKTKELAAMAYNIAAIEHFGEFARPNIITDSAMKGTK